MSFVKEKNRKWWGLAALIPALAMIFTDQSVLPVALPTIQKQLGASHIELQWFINSYLLVTAVLSLACGKIGDRMGHRRAFTLGILIFSIASALCGLSFEPLGLIFARAVQGVGAAFMIPASGALLMSLFSSGERGKATGINTSVSALFLIIAPLIGGYFTENLSWRWIFWINLPVALLGVILVFLFIPKSIKGEQKFDPWGFTFFLISSTSLVVFLMQGGEWGWGAIKTIALFILCLISGVFLFLREKRAKHPFLDISLFKHPLFKGVNISIFAIQFVLMITVFRTIFFQDTLDWSPLKAGVVTVISSLPVLFMSPIGGMLSDRFGPKIPIGIGFILIIYSLFWVGFFNQSALWIILIGLFVFAIGIPLIFTPSYSSAMSSIPPKKSGIAFGTITTVRSLSASFGVAAIGCFIENVQWNSFQKLIYENGKTKTLDPSFLEGLSLGSQSSYKTLASIPSEKANLILGFLKESQVDGFFYSHVCLGLLLIIPFVIVFILYSRKSLHKLPESPAEGWD